MHVDPITGDKITTVTKTKVERNRDGKSHSRSSSSSSDEGRMGPTGQKSKHSYEKKIVNTPDGP